MKVQAYGISIDLSKYDGDQLVQFMADLVDDIEHYSNYHRVKDYDECKEAYTEALEYIIYRRK